MHRVRLFGLAASLLCALALGARAQEDDQDKDKPREDGQNQELTIGDKAPPLRVSKWVKGEKVEGFEPDQTYVVEFWATWCGPCRVSIPHLTELQKKHEDVNFIGVSVWEQSQDGVEPFVKEMGDKMDYRVALDEVPEGESGGEGQMAKTWMTAAGENGIPTAFIIQGGKVAWIGHPMSMDKPLAQVVAGEYDIEAAARERKEAKAAEQKLLTLQTTLVGHLRAERYADALGVIDEAIADNEALERQLGMMKFMLMARINAEGTVDYGKSLVEGAYKDNPMALNNVAWLIIDPSREGKADADQKAFALDVARRADELSDGKNPAILDTLARAYFVNDQPEKAVECETKAIELSEDQDPGMKQRLEEYQEAAEGKAGGGEKAR